MIPLVILSHSLILFTYFSPPLSHFMFLPHSASLSLTLCSTLYLWCEPHSASLSTSIIESISYTLYRTLKQINAVNSKKSNISAMLVTRHWFHVNRCINIIMYITSQSRSSWKLNNKSITVHILRIINDGDAPIRRSNWVLLASLLLFAIKLIVLFRFKMKSIPFALTKPIVWLNVFANSLETACLFFNFRHKQ